MANELGIENLENLAKGLIDVSDTIDDALADGKIDFVDLPKVVELGGSIAKFKGAKDALSEALDLTEDETITLESRLMEYAESKLADEEPDTIEKIVKDSIDTGLSLARLLSNF